jgi:hypothetical protein
MTLNLVDGYPAYLTAGTRFQRMAPPSGTTALGYATFNEDPHRQLLPFVDTDLMYPGDNNQVGDPSLLRYFYQVRFGGAGKLFVRALVDETEVARGYLTMAEDSNQASIFHLPDGTAGYGLRLQLIGLAWWRYFYIDWDPVGEVQP